MISTARRIPILRYALIVFLTIILAISAFYLYFHYTKAESIRYNFNKVIQTRGNSNLIDSCIIDLFNAENNSRMFALTKDDSYYRQFSEEIRFVSNAIHKINARSKYKFNINDKKFDNLLVQKKDRTNEYFRLITLTDSLLITAKKMNVESHISESNKLKAVLINKISAKIKTDTINPTLAVKPKKRKLFSRIFDAMSKKRSEEQLRSNEVKSINAVKKNVDSIIKNTRFVNKAITVNGKNYQDLLALNHKIKTNELELLTINNKLIHKIINDLRNYKIEEQAYITNSNITLDDNLQEVVHDFKKISTLFFAVLAATVLLVLYNIWKIFKNDEELIAHSEFAEQNALSKTAFLASMSHEIRTPLNSVIGFSEQLIQSKLNDIQSEQVKAISSSSKMLLDVVNEILDFSKYETGKMHFEVLPFKPYLSLLDVFSSIKILAEKKGLVFIDELDINPKISVAGDQVRLKQVVINLLNNAIKFTSSGSIVLKAWTIEHDNGSLTLNVSVKDSGIGIEKENLSLIFDEFSQVESAQKKTLQKGTGLGLAICKKIVELQGGTISVTSESGKGSTFSFALDYQLSIALEEQDLQINAIEPSNHLDLAGTHVLVADDNELNLLLVSTILKKWDITFDTALNGVEALCLFEKNNYDLLLTDIEMPHMGGVELSKSIRSFDNRKSTIPILALTANAMKEDTDRYVKAGMNGVIVKPFSEGNFLSNVKEALANS